MHRHSGVFETSGTALSTVIESPAAETESFADLFEELLSKQEMRQGEVITAEVIALGGDEQEQDPEPDYVQHDDEAGHVGERPAVLLVEAGAESGEPRARRHLRHRGHDPDARAIPELLQQLGNKLMRLFGKSVRGATRAAELPDGCA